MHGRELDPETARGLDAAARHRQTEPDHLALAHLVLVLQDAAAPRLQEPADGQDDVRPGVFWGEQEALPEVSFPPVTQLSVRMDATYFRPSDLTLYRSAVKASRSMNSPAGRSLVLHPAKPLRLRDFVTLGASDSPPEDPRPTTTKVPLRHPDRSLW